MSEPEPELGLGVVTGVDAAAKRIAVDFPATGEKRLYALGTAVLRRVVFRAGEAVVTRDGARLTVETVEDEGGVLTYAGQGLRVREDAIADTTSVSRPQERLMAGRVDSGEVFDLRLQALRAQARFRQSEVRGCLGGRVDLIPHQLFILREVTSRQIPRALLADEVGLGKTIEACLILQRLLVTGRARRVLILVPESLTHQWFVELLRRFNLWFSIHDEERCAASERGDPGHNPFLASQLVLCGVSFLAGSDLRREQAVAAGWDMVVVDEAHHLAWSPDRASPEYSLVEALAARAPGLLLLTATPTQLGATGHFARLRLLDPDRYDDYDRHKEEAESFGAVAAVAAKVVEGAKLTQRDRTALRAICKRDAEGLTQHLDDLDRGAPGAREALLKTLLDRHGPGRVVFRNTRAAMAGFPKRRFRPEPLAATQAAQPARSARELHAEESGGEAGIRHSFKEDPRLDWLVKFLQRHREAKALLICRSQRKVAALATALQERTSAKVALFHEGLPLVQRDRHAAWFAEPDGAQLLICSEIGSEGRNFQFAHHLILFDLPLNPGLLEQRIGRLDRIGQTRTIEIHVPYVEGGAEEAVADWYHRGLDAFETPLHGGDEYRERFRERVLAAVTACVEGGKAGRTALDGLVAETAAFREQLTRKMREGRDRLLELNSFDAAAAAGMVERIRREDGDPFLRAFLLALLDHFGVRVREEEGGDVFFDPSHAYIEGFPSIPADGMLATFDRRRAIAREDIRFISADHPLVRDAIDLLIDSPAGTAAFGALPADEPNLLLEAVYVCETVADGRWQVDRFLAPTPVRVVVDIRGRDLSGERPMERLASDFEDREPRRFLERPGFDAALLKTMLTSAEERAGERVDVLRREAAAKAAAVLKADLDRLLALRRINDHVRDEEIELAQEQARRTLAAIEQARLRLDSLRLVVEGDEEDA